MFSRSWLDVVTLYGLEQSVVEGQRQQLLQSVQTGGCGQVGQRHLEIAAELPQNLPAGAAWRRSCRDRDEVPGPISLRDSTGKSRALGTDPERIGRILDVDTLDHSPVTREHGAADVEVRVRRVRARSRGIRNREELVVRDRQAHGATLAP